MSPVRGDRRTRTALGALVLSGARVVTKSIDLLTLVILARFLVQEDFGLVATALIFVQVAESVFDIPLANVLLRLKAVNRRHIDNLFTFGLLRGLVLSSLLCLLSYPLALFYEDMRLVALICTLSLAPVLRGLRSPRLALASRRLNYVPEAVAEATGKVASLVIAASLAIATGSYWAIAAATVVAPLISALVSFAVLPFLPKLGLHHWALFRSFMSWTMAGQAIGAISWQGDRMVLGKVTTLANVGLFAIARDLATNTIIAIVNTMTLPVVAALSSVSHDRRRLAEAYSQALSAILAVTMPIVIGQALVADALVPLLLGPQWHDAIPLFQIFCLATVPALYVNPSSALFYACGRPDLLFTRNLIDFCYRIPLIIVLSINYGIMGAACAILAGDLLMSLVCAVSVRKLTGISLLGQLNLATRAILGCAAMAAAVELVRVLGGSPGGGLDKLSFLAVAAPVGALAYVAASLILWLLAGKPDGIERLALQFFGRKLSGWKDARSSQLTA